MERPPESLKSFANRIASLAQSSEAAQMIRLLLFSGFMGASAPEGGGGALSQLAAPPDPLPPAGGDPTHLGIWERREEGGKVAFVRRLELMHEWHLWANVGRIEAKGARKRVVLIGESVARGYLYDPEYTPASALEAMLKARLGDDEIEVIDLARVNLSYEIRELALAALQLEPDVVIMLAGNNWGLKFPQASEVVEINEAVTQEGIRGAKRASEAHISRNARRVVADVASVYAERGVPLVWMIPEFNLADWRDPVTNAPHLPGRLNREWLDLLAGAES
ncbi:MAG TPA: SGNH/GDSL hydrolase family protein, partial [Pyrinomonadaceae bacterium]